MSTPTEQIPEQTEIDWMEAGLVRIAAGPYTDGYSRQIATDALAKAGRALICVRCHQPIEKGQASLTSVHASHLSSLEIAG